MGSDGDILGACVTVAMMTLGLYGFGRKGDLSGQESEEHEDIA